MSVIDTIPLNDLKCTKCGARPNHCDCWVVCSCGWVAEKHKPCNNPNSTGCSTKRMYGKKRKKETTV